MNALARSLHDALGGRWSVRALQASAICATWRAEGDTALFVKSLPTAQADVLDAEADGLAALAGTGTIRVPAVVGRWDDGESGQALLALEWLDLHGPDAGYGDLWSGNLGMLADGTPVVYDPAVSCSDAVAELAMMELFGALPPGFRKPYAETAGLHAGYPSRRPLYQLVHLLNHAVLFGGAYVAQSLALARRLA